MPRRAAAAVPAGGNALTPTPATAFGPFFLVGTIADNTTTTYTVNVADTTLQGNAVFNRNINSQTPWIDVSGSAHTIAINGTTAVTASGGTSCTITAIVNGYITAATCI